MPVLTIGATGEAREKGIHENAREYEFADLKGDLDSIGALAGGFDWKEGGATWTHAARRGTIHLQSINPQPVISSEARNLSSSNAASELPNSTSLGVAGQLARRVAEKFKLRQEIFLAEIELETLYAQIRAAKEVRRYEPLPRFPAVERDFSLLLADGTAFSDVVKTIRLLNIGEITSIDAADLFRGKNVPAGKYSLLGARNVSEPRSHADRRANQRLLRQNYFRSRKKSRRAASSELKGRQLSVSSGPRCATIPRHEQSRKSRNIRTDLRDSRRSGRSLCPGRQHGHDLIDTATAEALDEELGEMRKADGFRDEQTMHGERLGPQREVEEPASECDEPLIHVIRQGPQGSGSRRSDSPGSA